MAKKKLKPVGVKFEKASGAVNTYAVEALDSNYQSLGLITMVPGDEAKVSHASAHEMVTELSGSFSLMEGSKIDMTVVMEELDASTEKADAAEKDSIVRHGTKDEQIRTLFIRLNELEQLVSAIDMDAIKDLVAKVDTSAVDSLSARVDELENQMSEIVVEDESDEDESDEDESDNSKLDENDG